MKKLSIEEKAKAYDEAIKYAQYLINERCKENTDGSFHRADLNRMFPKLVENEDERIRKALIDYFRWNPNSQLLNEFSNREVFAYLEKQDKNNMGISEATKKKLEDNLNKALEQETPESWNEFLENQSKQKTVEEIAKEVCKDKASAVVFLKSAGIMNEKGELAEQYRQDEQNQNVNIQINPSEYINDMGGNGCYLKNTTLNPTDKVEPKFHEGDIIIHKELGGDYIHNSHKIIQVDILDKKYRLEGGLVAHFSEQDDYELVEQNPVWSEEDEKTWKEIFSVAARASLRKNPLFGVSYDYIKWQKFLNSLKERYTWKPSKEQMDALNLAIGEANSVDTAAGDEAAEILTSLYKQLKKLKKNNV